MIIEWGHTLKIYSNIYIMVYCINRSEPNDACMCLDSGTAQADLLPIEPLGTNVNDMLIKIQQFSLRKLYLKMSSANGGPFVSASMWIRLITGRILWIMNENQFVLFYQYYAIESTMVIV